MSSTYTTNGKFEKQGSGENSGSWGTGHLNPKTIDMTDEAIFSCQQVDIAAGSVTLVIPDGTTGNGRAASIELTGNISSNNRTATMPASCKVTTVRNATTQTTGVVTIKTSGGSNSITIPNGATRTIYSNGAESFQGDADQALIGRQSFLILAQAMTPLTTNGASSVQTELTAGNPEIVGLSFDGGSVAQSAQFGFPMPKSWDKGTVTFEVHWTSATTGTNAVYFAIAGVAISDGDAINASYGTAVTITDAAQSAANKKYKTDETAAMTFGGSPANGDMLYVKLTRDPTNVADTISEVVTVLGVTMFFNTNAGNDA